MWQKQAHKGLNGCQVLICFSSIMVKWDNPTFPWISVSVNPSIYSVNLLIRTSIVFNSANNCYHSVFWLRYVKAHSLKFSDQCALTDRCSKCFTFIPYHCTIVSWIFGNHLIGNLLSITPVPSNKRIHKSWWRIRIMVSECFVWMGAHV